MQQILITGANIVNEGRIFEGSVLIRGDRIEEVIPAGSPTSLLEDLENIELIDGRGKFLLPGVIDDQVHFRDPGLTHKGDLYSESKAAVAGGVTSFMDMPNTDPKATTLRILEEKYNLASKKSLANYSFFLGATNENLEEIEKADPAKICGVKVFMGASTGNMLVDDPDVLEKIFSKSRMIVAIHSEDEGIIRKNLAAFREKYGEQIPIEAHPLIRSGEACFASTKRAVELAAKHNTRLHVLHLSTAKELELLRNDIPLKKKRITAEVCVHHLWFDDHDYARLGSRIKWNPAIKTEQDKEGLFKGLLEDKIDLIATDHAPHLEEEKAHPYLSCPSGGPLIQHSLVIMLEFFHLKKISIEKIVEKMCHAPAVLYHIKDRGFIRKGCFADLVLVDPDAPWTVSKENILYKCGWSPFEGTTFSSRISHTFVNGNPIYRNGNFDERYRGKRLEFNP
ncbi:MAG TPA: dihydroorotase [Bacteroidales bacterium]|nr:dihydroorotase [Bacteroidales bacterium]